MVLRHSYSSFFRRGTSAGSIILLCWLAIGCAGYTQKQAATAPSTSTLTLSSSAFDFQTIAVGQKATQNLTLTNSGKDALQVSAISLSSDQFLITGPAVPRTILPGASLAYTVTFAPTTSGSATASLNISASSDVRPRGIPLKGTGTAPSSSSLTLSSSAFDFQTVLVGQKATQNLTLSNSGKDPLQVSAISLASDQFSVTGPSIPRTILPGNTLAYTVTFAPTTSGSATASLNISASSDVQPTAIPLKGTGQKALANLVITPSVISFGNHPLKSTSTQNVTLQNTGDINVSLQGVTVSGAGFGFADLSPGFSLAPNQKVIFQVWFSPKTAGPASGTLTLLSANLSSPGSLGLSGDGVTPAPTPAPHACSHACSYACSHACPYACSHACPYACPHACSYACSHACSDYPAFCRFELGRQLQSGDWLSRLPQRDFRLHLQPAEWDHHHCLELLGFHSDFRDDLLLRCHVCEFHRCGERLLQSSHRGHPVGSKSEARFRQIAAVVLCFA